MFTFADQEREFKRALKKERSEGEAIGEIRGQTLGETRGRIQGKLETLKKLVEKGSLTIEEAAEEAHMSVDKFKEVDPNSMSL